jgi:pilus assembly protein TadC
VTAAVLLLAAALLSWPAGDVAARRRVRRLGWARRSGAGRPRRPLLADGPLRRRSLALAAGLAVAVLVGGGTGAVVGGGVVVLAERGLRRAALRGRRDGAELAEELPFACDLLAVCLAAGVPVHAALEAVGRSVPGSLGGELLRVAGLARLGAEPARAWHGAPPQLESLARLVQRAEVSGARAVPALTSLAGDLRSANRSAIEVGVRRAGVRVLAPLGLCFLPAFVCLGIVPLVIGLAGEVLP